MTESESWLPSREQNLVDLCDRWARGLKSQPTISTFGWNQAAVTAAQAAIEDFLTARVTYKGDNSRKNRLAKDEAKEAAKNAMRDFANTSIRYNKLMTEEQKREYGIHTPEPGSPVKVPTTSPRLIIDTGTRRRLIIFYRDEKSTRRGKPKGVHGIEIRWAILDHVPTGIEELINSSFDTNPPLTLVFSEQDRGKRVYLCGCWEIEREGEKGPFGAIEEAIIP
jgi:hypothetical protein